jgi:rod shape-determining protein MreD
MKARLLVVARDAGLLLALCALQIGLCPLLSVGDVAPDVVLLGVVYLAVRRGQLDATIAGFCAGLFLDLSIGEVAGLGALAKTLSGFVAGYFFQEDKAERFHQTPRFVLAASLVALLHQTVYLFAYLHSVNADVLGLYTRHMLGTTAYNAVLASVFTLVASRLRTRIRFAG